MAPNSSISPLDDALLYPLGLTCAELAASRGETPPGGVATPAYRALFRDGVMRSRLFDVALPQIVRRADSDGDEGVTTKFILPIGVDPRTGAALESESVLIPMIGRKGMLSYTLCVSSQVGCAMGCAFCQTAQMGLHRNLSPAQIVVQWLVATHALGKRPRNIVFMGMGEPLDNYDNVIQAIRVLTDHNGAAVPMSKICISTVGRIDGLEHLAAQVREPAWHRLNLAVSINAPNDEIRSQLMPVNRGMPMAALRRAIERWPIYGAAKICLEYVLIPGVNDAPEHARQLADYVRGLPAMVNVIPYNPRADSPWPAPDEADVTRFLADLTAAGAYAKRRRTKGRDDMAACGQLGNAALRRRDLRGVTVGAT